MTGRRHVPRGIGIGQAAIVVAEKVVALGFGQEAGKRAPRFRKDLSHAAQEPVELRWPREKDPAQHQSQAAIRVRFGVGERQRRAPRAAEDRPPFDPQVLAQPLEIGDEVRRAVVLKLGGRHGTPGAALIEQDHAPESGVEKAAVVRQAAAARPAVQEHDRHTLRIAACLPVELVQTANGEHAVRVRLDLREQRVGPCAQDSRVTAWQDGPAIREQPRVSPPESASPRSCRDCRR